MCAVGCVAFALGLTTIAFAQAPSQSTWQIDSLVWWRVMRHAWLTPDSIPRDNDDGEIAYSFAYRIEGATRYLRLEPRDSATWHVLRRDVRAILTSRDSDRHLLDYHGISAPVWSGTKNRVPDGTRSAMLVDNALIASALINAAGILHRGTANDRKLSSECVRAGRIALHAFDGDLRPDPVTGGEHYVFARDVPLREWEHGRVVPMNYSAAAALAWYRLGASYADTLARARAERLGRSLAADMWLDHDTLQWRYQTESVIEDIAHGGIVATYLMHIDPELTIGGTPTRQALGRTLHRLFRLSGDSVVIADHLDGITTGEARLRGTFAQWAEVLPAACELLPRIARAILGYRGKFGAQFFIGASALLESARSCPDGFAQLEAAVKSVDGVSAPTDERHANTRRRLAIASG
jgi:hypothetical protein